MSALSVKPIIQSDEPVDLGDDIALLAQPALRRIVHRLAIATVVQCRAPFDQKHGIARASPLQPEVRHPLFDDVGRYWSVQCRCLPIRYGGSGAEYESARSTGDEHQTPVLVCTLYRYRHCCSALGRFAGTSSWLVRK